MKQKELLQKMFDLIKEVESSVYAQRIVGYEAKEQNNGWFISVYYICVDGMRKTISDTIRNNPCEIHD